MAELQGGQKVRVLLAQALFGRPAAPFSSSCAGSNPDCHHMRMEMRAKPTGMIVYTIQIATPPDSTTTDWRSSWVR